MQASPDHAMAIQGHGRRCGALFLPSTRPTGGGAGWRGRAVPAQLAALPFPTAPQGISMGKGQGRESSSLGFRFFRRWQGGGQQLRRLRRRGRTSTMCPAITEEVAAGRFCGEKKRVGRQKQRQSCSFRHRQSCRARSHEKLSDLWALRESVGVIFWWKGFSISLDPYSIDRKGTAAILST